MSSDAGSTSGGCCATSAPATPEAITNRPGLSAIRYRVGTFASFREAMVAAIARDPRLAEWTARQEDDFGIALLEMWAYVGDILTFYQERIANEAFLGTARLRESVRRLAWLLNYQPTPSVAASAYLAFTLDKNKSVKIPVGLRAQSVPGQDEKPQKFETIEAIGAMAELNEVRILPRPQRRNPYDPGSTGGVLLSTPDEVAVGGRVVVFGELAAELKEVTALDEQDVQTVLSWAPAIANSALQAFSTRLAAYRRSFRLFGHNAPTSYLEGTPKSGQPTVVVWTQKTLGPDKFRLPTSGAAFPAPLTLALDGRYDDVKVGAALLLVDTGGTSSKKAGFARLATVKSTTSAAETLGNLSDTVTEVVLGAGVQGTPAVARDKAGALHVFAVGDDGALWHLQQKAANGAWSSWQSMGGQISSVAVGTNLSGRLEVFAVGTDGALWHLWQLGSGGWSDWATRGVPASGVWIREIAVGRNKDGRLEVFARGSDGALWHVWQIFANGWWWWWASRGTPDSGVRLATLAVASNDDGRLEVFGVGSDGALWHIWQRAPNDGWAEWASRRTPTATVKVSSISVGMNKDRRLEVFAVGSDGALWHMWQLFASDGWGGWASRGTPKSGVTIKSASSGNNEDGRLEVFGVGSDGALWHTWQVAPSNGWNGWGSRSVPKSGVTVKASAVGRDHGGRLHVFAAGSDGALYQMPQASPSDGWQSSWRDRGVPMWPVQDLRTVEVFELAGTPFALWNCRYPSAMTGDTVYARLSDLDDVDSKRTLILDDASNSPEVVSVTSAISVDADGDGAADHLAIAFTPSLTRTLAAGSAVLYGNVAEATHGETVAKEVLGNGDASDTFQSFSLKKSPVTFVSDAQAPHGAGSTLKVRVGRVLWEEEETLYGHGAEERVYVTTADDECTMTVHFGDGTTGARLPTGVDNVVATYRQGAGEDGNVKAGTITTLLDRPVGLKAVSNPAAAEGGASAESLKTARKNAPNTVRTFNRVVSLLDFEDAAREFTGIAKARATWGWKAGEMCVQLTVAGTKGVPPTDALRQKLRKYLDARRDPYRGLVIQSYTRVGVQIRAAIRVEDGELEETVKTAAHKALADGLGFDGLDLGEAIHLSNVFAVLQRTSGVLAVSLDTLMFAKPAGTSTASFYSGLKRRGARFHLEAGSEVPDKVQRHLWIWPHEMAYVAAPATDIVVDIETTSS